jgi:hypothetical protein
MRELTKLPALKDAPQNEKEELFLNKIKQCQVSILCMPISAKNPERLAQHRLKTTDQFT